MTSRAEEDSASVPDTHDEQGNGDDVTGISTSNGEGAEQDVQDNAASRDVEDGGDSVANEKVARTPGSAQSPPASGSPGRAWPRDARGKFLAFKPRDKRTKAPRPYNRHGLSLLKRTMRELGGRAIESDTPLGQALGKWRGELVDDIGGPAEVTTMQCAIVDVAVRTKLMLDSIDAWLLTQPTLVNRRRRTVLPVVLQRQQLADALARYMGQLGLERRAVKAPDLKSYLATRYGERAPSATTAGAEREAEAVTNRPVSDTPDPQEDAS